VTCFNERESSVSVLFPVCFSIWTPYLLQNSLQENWAHQDICTFSLTHIWTCYIWKLENESAFTNHAENESGKHQAHLSFSVKKLYRRLLLARKANEWKGEQSANNVAWLQIKVSVLLLSLWAAEMPLWVLIRKRKVLKVMWVACPGYSFRSQPHLVKSEAEIMLADLAEALGKWSGGWIGVSRDVCQGSQAAHLMPSFLQFMSRTRKATTCRPEHQCQAEAFFPPAKQLFESLSPSLSLTASMSTDLGET
jgi:hypothetical protein